MRSIRVMACAVTLAAGASLLSGCGSGAAGSTDAGASVSVDALVDNVALDGSARRPKGQTITGALVDRVVDGDTLHVLAQGRDITVRLIGINTPETVKPGSPVECFGPESSDFAKRVLTGQRVTLEFDATQGMTDQYGRTLAYVWVERPGGGLILFNRRAVAGGYAFERQYTKVPYAWKSEFVAAERAARRTDAGLWGACPQS